MNVTLTATCLFGLEHLLGEEIEALGYDRTETIDGRITYRGDEEAIALSNVFLRYAERVFINLGRFRADTFDDLFEGTKALPWESWIGRDDAFPVKGHSIKSKLFSIPDCQRIVKRAIVDRLSSVYGLTRFPETGVTYQVEFFILKDEATLMIDTSGDPLHKRGYRPQANVAPIRETLAAAIAAISRPREDVLFWDPMCGSGTIAIEAAMQMKKIAPGARRRFAAERFPAVPRSVWLSAREEARDTIVPTKFEVYASDIDPDAVVLTQENARRAGVDDRIRAFEADARKISAPGRRGTVVSNPPYGERMMTVPEVETLYRELGRHFRDLAPWQIYIISSVQNFETLYGKRADKTRKLYNGMIPCVLYQYFKNEKNDERIRRVTENKKDDG
ncbi:MAG: class I SAM-dependent RNA methyltransferase [Clostridia bacterium]|nr:class I SAM-dependent RNA methyltransferase [Clostridia bacterium]